MNVVLRGGAEIAGLLLGVISTVWVSRAVGPSYFGYYAVTLTAIALGSTVINAGLSTAGSQRVANQPELAAEVWWAVLVGRTAIAVPTVLAAMIVIVVAPLDPILRDFLVVGMVASALMPLRAEWLLVAQGRLRAVSLARVLGSAGSVLAAILLIHDPADAALMPWVPVTYAMVAAVATVLLSARSTLPRRPKGESPRAVLGGYVRDGANYLKNDVSVFIFTTSDRLFLYVFATTTVVGLYEAAYRVIQPFYTISAVVGDALYLPLAKSYGGPELQLVFRRYVDLMCFATVPLGVFLLLFAPTVIEILYGPTYADATPYLAILGWVITFGYTSAVAVVPFSAWNRPREFGNATGLGGAFNLIFNVLLIPPFQGLGAAWATVLAKVVVTIAGIRYFRRATDYPLVRDWLEYLAISAAAGLVALASSQLAPPGPFGLIAFGLVYVPLVGAVRWRKHLGSGSTRAPVRPS